MRKPFNTTCDIYKGPGTLSPGLFVGTFACRLVVEDGIHAIGGGCPNIPAYMTIEGYEPQGAWTQPFFGMDPDLCDRIAIPTATPARWWVLYTDIIIWFAQPAYYRAYLVYLPTTPVGPGGGILFDGSAIVSTIPPFLTWGGILFDGSAIVSTIPPFLTWGGILFDGSAIVSTIPPFLTWGGLLLDVDTSASITRKRFLGGDGGVLFDGTATVVFTPGSTTLWLDHFNAADGTNLTSHSPDVGSGGYTSVQNQFQIFNNRISLTPSFNAFNSFDPGATSYSYTCDFSVETDPGGIGPRYARFVFRYQDLSNHWYVDVNFNSGINTISSFTLKKVIAGVTTTVATGSTTLNTATPYTCLIVVTASTVSATINGVTVNVFDSALNTQTRLAISADMPTTASWIDEATVTS